MATLCRPGLVARVKDAIYSKWIQFCLHVQVRDHLVMIFIVGSLFAQAKVSVSKLDCSKKPQPYPMRILFEAHLVLYIHTHTHVSVMHHCKAHCR